MWQYRGRVGEYMWEKEKQRLDRYKDRPWELESKAPSAASALFVLLFVCLASLGGLFLLSLI